MEYRNTFNQNMNLKEKMTYHCYWRRLHARLRSIFWIVLSDSSLYFHSDNAYIISWVSQSTNFSGTPAVMVFLMILHSSTHTGFEHTASAHRHTLQRKVLMEGDQTVTKPDHLQKQNPFNSQTASTRAEVEGGESLLIIRYCFDVALLCLISHTAVCVCVVWMKRVWNVTFLGWCTSVLVHVKIH